MHGIIISSCCQAVISWRKLLSHPAPVTQGGWVFWEGICRFLGRFLLPFVVQWCSWVWPLGKVKVLGGRLWGGERGFYLFMGVPWSTKACSSKLWPPPWGSDTGWGVKWQRDTWYGCNPSFSKGIHHDVIKCRWCSWQQEVCKMFPPLELAGQRPTGRTKLSCTSGMKLGMFLFPFV